MVAQQSLILIEPGVIDAAVSGGVAQFSLFLEESFIREHPQFAKYVTKLQQQLIQQSGLLEEGLKLHSELVPSNLIGLHQKLESKHSMDTTDNSSFLWEVEKNRKN